MQILGFLAWGAILCGDPLASALKVAFNPQWIEGTPFTYANRNLYKGSDTATAVSGGVASISDRAVELGGNAATQGLKQYVRNKNYRLIYIVVDVTYRIVANKAAGIRTITDLKGKRVGSIPGTSAEVFVRALLGNAGLANSDYTVVSGNVCMKTPCGSGTFPAQLKSKSIDAFGVWETAVQLGVEAIGEENAVIFKNASVYREVYSLYATTENLNNPATRKKIVEYVKALNTTLEIFRSEPEKVYPTVAQAINVDVPVLRKVWEDHVWGPRSLGDDLVDFLLREDQLLARMDRRTAATRAEIEKFIDKSVYEDARKL